MADHISVSREVYKGDGNRVLINGIQRGTALHSLSAANEIAKQLQRIELPHATLHLCDIKE